MNERCEMTTLRKAWTRDRCKRNATVTVGEKRYCEQHAKIALGMPPAIGQSARERLDERFSEMCGSGDRAVPNLADFEACA